MKRSFSYRFFFGFFCEKESNGALSLVRQRRVEPSHKYTCFEPSRLVMCIQSHIQETHLYIAKLFYFLLVIGINGRFSHEHASVLSFIYCLGNYKLFVPIVTWLVFKNVKRIGWNWSNIVDCFDCVVHTPYKSRISATSDEPLRSESMNGQYEFDAELITAYACGM